MYIISLYAVVGYPCWHEHTLQNANIFEYVNSQINNIGPNVSLSITCMLQKTGHFKKLIFFLLPLQDTENERLVMVSVTQGQDSILEP